MIRILGIDPGSLITGYGVIEMQSNRLVYITNGCIRTQGDDLAGKLHDIFRAVDELVTQYTPHEVAIESVFVSRNVSSALKLGQARGSAITAVALRHLPVIEYTPSEIKKAVVGRGNATKLQVQHMIKALLNLKEKQQADAADALAVAICHGHSRSALRQLGRLTRTSRSSSRWRLKG